MSRRALSLAVVGALGASLAGVLIWKLRQRPESTRFNLPTLTVLSYDSFTSLTGPGRELVANFERVCGCRVEILTAGDGGLVLEKLKLTLAGDGVDVVIGLDQMNRDQALAEVAWRPLALPVIPIASEVRPYWESPLIPIDWAPLTFLYRQSETPGLSNPRELAGEALKRSVAIEDPRTSAPGRQFLWAAQVWGGERGAREFLREFRGSVQTVTGSWSAAYGLFQRRQVKMVFSYVTSLAYHWLVEKDFDYQALTFSEGHPLQIELVGVPARCRHCQLAEDFVAHLLSEDAQVLLMNKNFMFPVRAGLTEDTLFGKLPQLKTFTSEQFAAFKRNQHEVEAAWAEVMR